MSIPINYYNYYSYPSCGLAWTDIEILSATATANEESHLHDIE